MLLLEFEEALAAAALLWRRTYCISTAPTLKSAHSPILGHVQVRGEADRVRQDTPAFGTGTGVKDLAESRHRAADWPSRMQKVSRFAPILDHGDAELGNRS